MLRIGTIAPRTKLKLLVSVFCAVLLFCTETSAGEQQPPTPTLFISTNYFATIGETFQISVSIVPASQSKQVITMDPTWGTAFSRSTFALQPGQTMTIDATVKKSKSGLAWIHASSPCCDAGWWAVVVDFDGGLKLSTVSPIAYGSSATMTITMVDRAGKPLRVPVVTQVQLTSADGLLSSGDSSWKHSLNLSLPQGSQTSPQFQLRSTSIQGGVIHLSGALSIEGQNQVLTQEDYQLNSDPAVWLTIVLAICGGLVHGAYKTTRLFEDPAVNLSFRKAVAILTVSGLAGLIGFFFAHLDLLGLKIDPNVLRSYPLIGFLFSYVGFEVLVPKKWSGTTGT